MSKISTVPVVRRRGRGGREFLRLAAAGFPDRKDPEEQPSIARPGRPARCWWWSFTLAGQRFMALNGGTRFEYTHAISFKIDCADQAEVDRLWTGYPPMAGRRTLRLAEGSLRRIVADLPTALVQYLAVPITQAPSARCRQ